LLLQDFPEIRGSYDLIIEKYFSTYRDEKVHRSTLERDIRVVQYDMGIYPPSENVRKASKCTKDRLIKSWKDRKKGRIRKILDYFFL